MYSLFVVLSIVIVGVYNQIEYDGRCDPKANVFLNETNIEDILGIWYVKARIPNFIETGDCVNRTVVLLGDDIAFEFTIQKVDGKYKFHVWSLEVIWEEPLRLITSYGQYQINQYIVAADMKSVIFLYGCVYHPKNDTRHVFAWILSRTKEVNEKFKTEMRLLTDRVPDLWFATLQEVHHTDC